MELRVEYGTEYGTEYRTRGTLSVGAFGPIIFIPPPNTPPPDKVNDRSLIKLYTLFYIRILYFGFRLNILIFRSHFSWILPSPLTLNMCLKCLFGSKLSFNQTHKFIQEFYHGFSIFRPKNLGKSQPDILINFILIKKCVLQTTHFLNFGHKILKRICVTLRFFKYLR